MKSVVSNVVKNIVRVGLGASGGWTPQRIGSKLLYWGAVSEIAGGEMPNKVTGATDHIDIGGSAGSYTFQVPNTASYIAADTDYIWFKTDETSRTTTEAELVGYDFPRTPVKYDNATSYLLREIIILKAGEVLSTGEGNAMRDYMELSLWWDNTLSAYGNLKGNRGSSKSVWYKTDETRVLIARFTTPSTAGLTTAIDNLIYGLQIPGYWSKIDCLQKYNMIAVDQAILNWKGNSMNAIQGGTHFITKIGIETQIAVDGHLDTGFNPASGVQFTQNSATWIHGHVSTTGNQWHGCNSAGYTTAVCLRTDGNFLRFNGVTQNNGGETALRIGYNAQTRSGAAVNRYYNGSWWALNKNSVGRPNCNLYLGAYNDDGVQTNNSFYTENNCELFGAYFTDAEVEAIIALLEDFDAEIALL